MPSRSLYLHISLDVVLFSLLLLLWHKWLRWESDRCMHINRIVASNREPVRQSVWTQLRGVRRVEKPIEKYCACRSWKKKKTLMEFNLKLMLVGATLASGCNFIKCLFFCEEWERL